MQAPEEKTLQVFVQSHPDKRNEVIRSMKQSLAPLVDKFVRVILSVVYVIVFFFCVK